MKNKNVWAQNMFCSGVGESKNKSIVKIVNYDSKLKGLNNRYKRLIDIQMLLLAT